VTIYTPMFRFVARNTAALRSLSTRRHLHTTAAVRMPAPFVPEDWRIIKTSPGGRDKDFVNDKTGEQTWYTPEGMTAEEILRVPGAREYWNSVSDVQEYIKEMAEQKARSGGKDIKDV